MNNREILYHALTTQQLHEYVVVKDDIHLRYKYKNINKAMNQASTLQDKIIEATIEDAVTGTSNPIKKSSIQKQVENILDTNLRNDTKRFSRGIPDKYVEAAVSNISNRFQWILNNRIREEIPNLQSKIENTILKEDLGSLSESELRDKLTEIHGEHAQKRISNIIRDSFHTNECNISWIKAVNEGYSYKVWMNGRSKGKTRAWHRAKNIESVPIDETFDIYGSYPAHMMYPGDLNGGAENVANCRCWLNYTNNKPSDLRGSGKKTTTKKSSESKNSDKSKDKKQPKNKPGIGQRIKNKIKNSFNKLKRNNKKNSINKQIQIDNIDTEIHSESLYEFDKENAKKKLIEGLPSEFSDEAIDYLLEILEKKGNSKYEYGQIFEYKTGKGISVECGGYSETAVNIEKEGPPKSINAMTEEELNEYLANPKKYDVDYVKGKSNLASQHNHTRRGLSPPSTSDFLYLIEHDYLDFLVAISTKEIWVIEYKSKFNLPLSNRIGENIGKIEDKAIKMKGEYSKDQINEWYGNEIKENINKSNYNIKLYQVIL